MQTKTFILDNGKMERKRATELTFLMKLAKNTLDYLNLDNW